MVPIFLAFRSEINRKHQNFKVHFGHSALSNTRLGPHHSLRFGKTKVTQEIQKEKAKKNGPYIKLSMFLTCVLI